MYILFSPAKCTKVYKTNNFFFSSKKNGKDEIKIGKDDTVGNDGDVAIVDEDECTCFGDEILDDDVNGPVTVVVVVDDVTVDTDAEEILEDETLIWLSNITEICSWSRSDEATFFLQSSYSFGWFWFIN